MHKLALLFLLVFPNICLAQREYGFDNSKPSGQPYLDPEETVRRIKVPDGFEVKLFAAEPLLTNPIAFTLDEKGRVWVIECFEYPSRTPPGKMPRDRIVILEDTDGDGRADKRTIFAEGKDFPKRFDLASGLEVGYGGCFVGAAPYLWHLKDTDGDGKADQFDILLEGFGSQDTHETLNTFTWGPDGWLYGLHGVFTSSKVGEPGASAAGGSREPRARSPVADAPGSPVEIDAGVWRYHPKRKKFEVFAEGTSNPWGMDFDSSGNCFACCCVIPHLFHIVPGGIYRRQAGASKHPYAFSELREICDHTFHKESGWAHAGLLCLDTPAMPAEFRTSVIFGSIHGNSLKRNVLRTNGSSFIASKAPDFLSCGDKNFRPVGLRWGPGGTIYVSDWHDQNPCHQAKPESWDYARGRIYVIAPKNKPRSPTIDLAKLSPEQQLERLGDESPWTSRQVARLLMEDPRRISNDLHPRLKERVIIDHQAAGFGVYHAWDEFVREELPNAKFISEFLSAKEGRSVGYRRAGLRNFGESQWVKQEHLDALAVLAKNEPDPAIRLELAVVALRQMRRLNAKLLLRACLSHVEDASDPTLPLVLWQAYEKQAFADADAMHLEQEWLAKHGPGNALLIDHLVPRYFRRVVSYINRHPQDALLATELMPLLTPNRDYRVAALRGYVAGFMDHPRSDQTDFTFVIDRATGEERELLETLQLLVGGTEGRARALSLLKDDKSTVERRKVAMAQLGRVREASAIEPLLALVDANTDEDLKLAALEALDEFPNADLARRLLPLYAKASPPLRRALLRFASSRKEWARDLLAAVGDTGIPRTDISDFVILRLRAFNDHALDDLIEKRWGRFRATPAEVEEEIKSWELKLRQQPGVAERGRVVFTNRCAQCHQFAGQGSEVGPALDGADRSVNYLLVNILDPNRVVGAPYFARVILLKNGKLVTGLLVAEDEQTLTVKKENAIREVIRKADIEEQKAADQSLMPADLVKQMKEEEFRDLMEYLRRK